MDMFKSKTERHEPEVVEMADPYAPTRNALQDWLVANMGEGQQYKGDMVSKDMTDQEKKSLGYLDQYAGNAIPSIWSAGEQELQKTLKGDYDPASSPYYQAVKAESARNLADTQKNIADQSAGGGRYYSGARLKKQGDAATDVANNLNVVLGQQAEAERQRMMQAVPLAGQYGEYQQRLPLQQAAALQTYGSLPRTISDAYNMANYNEWQQATRNWPLSVAGVASGVQQAPLYGQVGYSQTPSPFSSVFNPVMEGIGTGVGAALGTSSYGNIANAAIPKTASTVQNYVPKAGDYSLWGGFK